MPKRARVPVDKKGIETLRTRLSIQSIFPSNDVCERSSHRRMERPGSQASSRR